MLLAFGFYDVVTLAALMFIVAGFGVLVLLLLGLPGRIARQRNHPEAEAVNLMGWLGFLGVVPWINALIWSIKETDVIDIRRFPGEEREALVQPDTHVKKGTPLFQFDKRIYEFRVEHAKVQLASEKQNVLAMKLPLLKSHKPRRGGPKRRTLVPWSS